MKISNKIYFFVGSNFGEKGGVEIHLKNLILQLEKTDISVIANINKKYDVDRLLPESEIFYLPYDNSISSILKRVKFIMDLRRNAIFHFHDYNSFIKFGFFCKLKMSSKLYVTFHGWEGHYPTLSRDRLIRRVVGGLAESTINIGDFINSWYKTPAKEVIYGGVNVSNNDALNFSEDNQIIYFVGRVASDSGFISFVKFVRRSEYKKIYVFGANRDDLDHELSLIVADLESLINVEFLGWQENPYSKIPRRSKVFTTGYLSILEALEANLEIFSSYENPLKKDYLIQSPFSDYLNLIDSEKNIIIKPRTKLPNTVTWAEEYSWKRVVEAYERIWK